MLVSLWERGSKSDGMSAAYSLNVPLTDCQRKRERGQLPAVWTIISWVESEEVTIFCMSVRQYKLSALI